MDYEQAWCPACDRQIEPKRTTITVPALRSSPTIPPPPPSSPRKSTKASKKGGLVQGTGRVRHNGTIKPPPPPPTKQRTIIDQGPTALYCSDRCQFADINARRGAPIDPHREEPAPNANPVNPKKTFTTACSETESDSSSSSSVYSAHIASPSLAKMAELYNWGPLPPPPPVFEEECEPAPLQYNSGIMMAGRLLKSLATPPAKPQVGPYPPTPEPRKVVPGWTDGSNAWRSAIYSFAPPTDPSKDPFNRHESPPAPTSFSRRKSSTSSYSALALNSAPAAASTAAFHSASDEMLNKFSANLTRRCESRTSLYGGSYPTTSPASTQSLPVSPPKRERSILHRAAQGKLLVPDVKLKVHSSSSASLSSAWSGPTSSSSRRSLRSPLSATSSSSDEDNESYPGPAVKDFKVKRRPAQTTRSWSYDNVMTYDIMPVPPKKTKKMEKQIHVIDGEEIEVQVEVEVYEPLKRLFNFAPSISPSL